MQRSVINILRECQIVGNIIVPPQLSKSERAAFTTYCKKAYLTPCKGYYRQEDERVDMQLLLYEMIRLDGKGLRDHFQYFPTPVPVIELMLAVSEVKEYDHILEPSAGRGDIPAVLKEQGYPGTIDVCEYMDLNRSVLEKIRNVNIVGRDFLKYTAHNYSLILMNPPYSKGQDRMHFRHAYSILQDEGRVCCLFPSSIHTYTEFMDWIYLHDSAHVQDLGTGHFKGTSVGTTIVYIKNEGIPYASQYSLF